MCKNNLNRDFSTVKKRGREVTIFPENFKRKFYPKCLKSISNVMKDLPEVKTSESNKDNAGIQILSPLIIFLVPYKILIQNMVLA